MTQYVILENSEESIYLLRTWLYSRTFRNELSEWLHDNNIPVMDWPSESPDLNPIQHLWDILERRLRASPHRRTPTPLLGAAPREEWAAIPQESFQHLTERMPATVEAVIEVKAGSTPS